MSDGMSDARAEGEIYREVWNAVYDLREAMLKPAKRRYYDEQLEWSGELVGYVNELIADLGWRFEKAPYFSIVTKPRYEGQEEKLWDAVVNLREALRSINIGHRGWSPVIDRTVDGLMSGSGYLFVQFGRVW